MVKITTNVCIMQRLTWKTVTVAQRILLKCFLSHTHCGWRFTISSQLQSLDPSESMQNLPPKRYIPKILEENQKQTSFPQHVIRSAQLTANDMSYCNRDRSSKNVRQGSETTRGSISSEGSNQQGSARVMVSATKP